MSSIIGNAAVSKTVFVQTIGVRIPSCALIFKKMSKEHKLEIGYAREFLNLPYQTSTNSNIAYKISVNAWKEEIIKEKLYDHASVDFVITDCSDLIRLDFNVHTKEQMRNSLHKLDTIIATCQKMRLDLKTARLEILKAQKLKEKLETTKKD